LFPIIDSEGYEHYLGAENDIIVPGNIPGKGHFYTGFIWGWCYSTESTYDFDPVVLEPADCG
jgi:hypothetical protein